MRLTRVLGAVGIAVSLVAACGSGSDREVTAGAETDGAGSGTGAATPNPVLVEMHPDAAATTTAPVGPDGGTVAATAADGTRYELVVPAGALLAPAELTMAPLADATGLPEDTTLAFGVQLSPDGLVFARPAWLYVDAPGDATVTAGLAVDGDVASLRPIGFDGDRYVLPVAHFSGRGGVGFPGPSGWGDRFPPSPTGGSLQDDALSRGGPVDVPPPGQGFPPDAGTGREPPGPGSPPGNGAQGGGNPGASGPSLTDGLDGSAGGTGQGSSSDGDLTGDLRDWAEEAANAQLTGDEEGERRAEEKLEELRARLLGEIDELARICVEEKDATKLLEILRLQTIGQLIGTEDGAPEAERQQAIREACGRFELEVYGELMFDAPPVFHIGDSIELVVPLEYIGGWHEGSADGTVTPVGYDRGTEVLDVFAWGLGPLVGIDVPNDLTRNDYVHCSVAPGRGSVKVVAAGLFADDGPLVSVALATAAEAQVSCSDPVGTFGFPPFVTDVEELLETGIPEATDVGLFLQGWEHPGGGSPWATKEIHHQLSEEGVTLTIGWHFTIEHAPGELPPPRDTSPG